MKKFLALLLSVLMLGALCVPALAAGDPQSAVSEHPSFEARVTQVTETGLLVEVTKDPSDFFPAGTPLHVAVPTDAPKLARGDLIEVQYNGMVAETFPAKIGMVFSIRRLSHGLIAPNPNAVTTFSDVPADAWFAEAVAYVQEKGLMKGTGNHSFTPNAPFSRAMLITALWRTQNSPVVNYQMSFEDVEESAWYSEAVRWALSKKIAAGVDETHFAPNAPLTRQDAACILYAYAKEVMGKGFQGMWAFRLDFTDVDQIAEEAFEPVSWCVVSHILEGYNGKLDPLGSVNRAQAAVLLMRLFENA